jgi:hypothetical protein
MPFIGLVLSTLAAWLIYWFVHLGGLDRAADMLSIRRNARRRQQAQVKEHSAPIAAVDDPRDAALILMLLIAGDASAPTREQYVAIEERARVVLGFDKDLSDRMVHARFVAGRADSFEQAAGIFSKLLTARLTDSERHELIEMLEAIALHDGPSEAQRDAIEALKRSFLLA